MLFNSYLFIFIFLPLTLLLFFSIAKYSHQAALGVLLLASLIFYGWCDYWYVVILLSSIGTNFLLGNNIIAVNSQHTKKYFLWLGIIFNLGLLGYFKYVNFFIQNIDTVLHRDIPLLNIVLPIGISFFTFTQIAFLVDSYRDRLKPYSFLNYALFVTYFPHLIAGPIIHHKEVMPQFEKKKIFQWNSKNFLLGWTLFAIGLFKKTVLADYLVYFVDPLFDGHASQLSMLNAWTGALAYTFELYFDFSAYSDMALGLSLLIGIKLPINFYSPYKAINIIEFWRRWNMTLSRFLRDYLYIPLGGNRKGSYRRYLNLMVTMLLGGLWHGASWTFVLWGLLHGIYLIINHGWISLRHYLGMKPTNHFLINTLSRLITFIAVVVAWVFFRSPDVKTANQIVYTMFFGSATNQPWHLDYKLLGIMLISMLIVWLLPNAYQLLSRYKPALIGKMPQSPPKKRLLWQPTIVWNFFMALIFVLGMTFVQTSSVFLYFRF